MPIDRAAALRQAEKLLRQGKLELAIAEYLSLVEDDPRDWNTSNVLGDLYARAGHVQRAAEQFRRTAESLRREGFLSKAAALYKKILKLRPDDDDALIQSGELAAEQGLLAAARGFFAAAIDGRRQRGDVQGALRVVVRLGGLDPDDVQARLAAAHARHELGDVPGALKDLTDLATSLLDLVREDEALVPLRDIVALDPRNPLAVKELARILIKRGDVSAAAAYLASDAVGADPTLTLAVAGVQLRIGDQAAGFEMIDTLLATDPASSAAALDLALDLCGEQRDVAYGVVDRVVSTRIAEGDWPGAIEALGSFVARAPGHVPALSRLVEVSVGGGLADGAVEAQAKLSDAYLAAGSAVEARCVAEDLVRRQPWERAHFERLRAALEREGVAEPERALADWVAGTHALGTDDDSLRGRDAVEEPSAVATGTTIVPVRNPHAIDLDRILGLSAPEPAHHQPGTEAREAPEGQASDIESVFARLRDRAERRSPGESADVAYTRGAAMFEAGQFEESGEQLRLAARSPRRRFAAASLLARLHQQQQQTTEAIEWLRQAVDAPETPSAERFDALHRLADLLEMSGEPESALAVCLELQADAGDFRDLAARIARLSRTQAGRQ